MRYVTSIVAIAAAALSTGAANADFGDQLFKLLPEDGAVRDRFGLSVGISGDTAIVASLGWGGQIGSAYLFDVTTGTQIAKLFPADGGHLGRTVAISGEIALAGAPGHGHNGVRSGSAYLFDTTTGVQFAELLPDDGTGESQFGYSVALCGDTAIVGARADVDNGVQTGSAYLFDISDPTNPMLIARLLADDRASNDRFGHSVAISQTTAIVGAYRHTANASNSGSAYLFDTTTGRQLFELLPDDGERLEGFGWSVAISGATAIVGTPFDDDNGRLSGSAYLFDASTGGQIAKLLAGDGGPANFGISVAISGTTAIVGRLDGDNGEQSGSAYFFDTVTGRQLLKILPDDGATGDVFGFSVSISDATAIVGAFQDEDNGFHSGSAYLFDAGSSPSPGDLNCDGTIDNLDIEPFVLALFDPAQYRVEFPDCNINNADINADGTIDAFDIEPFLDLLFP